MRTGRHRTGRARWVPWMLGASSAVLVAVVLARAAGARIASQAEARPPLRICADPNNLPFSNRGGEGFENRLAALAAQDLGRRLEYTWWPQRRGFIRHTLDAGVCDAVMGLPRADAQVRTTRPYYRSTYVFVWPAARALRLSSLDDPRLRDLRIGVQMIGDDFANSPPAHALASRGIVQRVVGFSVYGDYSQPNPPARIIDAVASGQVDAAIAWGPLAGYFARREPIALTLAPVRPARDGAQPFTFDIAIAVRRDDSTLAGVLDSFLSRRAAEVQRVLDDFGVPRAPADAPPGAAPRGLDGGTHD
jgi:mxaJ protein